MKVLNKRKKLFEKQSEVDSDLNDEELLEVASKNFKSLLAGRFNTLRLDQMLFLLNRASTIPLRESMIIWSWFIENMNRRAEQSPKEIATLSAILESSLNAAELACFLAGQRNPGSRSSAGRANIFRDGERMDAMNLFRNWISDNAEDEILITDPYFGPDELDFVKLVQETKPEVHIKLLLSDRYIKSYVGSKSYEEIFLDKWAEISDENPPRVEIVVVGVKPQGDHPIHERWMVSKESGLRIGTSVHSIGTGKTSEISVLTRDEIMARRPEIEAFLGRNIRNFSGQKVSYTVVDL